MSARLVQCTIADIEKCGEWDKLGLLEKQKVVALGKSELDLLVVLYLKGGIVFRESLIEPRRHLRFAEISVNKKVYVFVKDRRVVGIPTFGGQCDVIHVLARHEVSGDAIVRLSIGSARFERPVRRITLENDNVGRDGRCESHAFEDQTKGFAKLFELCCYLADIALGCVSNEEKVL